MKAIVLAAGVGSRLGEIGKNVPKCLIEISGESILKRNLRFLENCGIKKEDIVVVIGGQGEVWSSDNQKKIMGMHQNVIVNNQNVDKNQVYSFWLAAKDINDGTVCIDGDSVFDESVVRGVIESEYESCFVTRLVPGERRMRVLVDNGRVKDFGKELNSERVYTPILKFSKEFLDAMKREFGEHEAEYSKTSIDAIIKNICEKHEIFNVNLEGLGKFVNINTPEEYAMAQESFAPRKNFVALMSGYTGVGKSTTAKKISRIPDTEIHHSAVVRKELGLSPKDKNEADKLFDYRNNLREQMDRKVYGNLAERAFEAIKNGKNVVLDAGYFFKWQRGLVYEKVKEFNPEIFIVRVVCKDEEEIKRRFEKRAAEFNSSPLNETPSWNTYLATKLITEPFDEELKENNTVAAIEYDTLTNEAVNLGGADKAINGDSIFRAIRGSLNANSGQRI